MTTTTDDVLREVRPCCVICGAFISLASLAKHDDWHRQMTSIMLDVQARLVAIGAT